MTPITLQAIFDAAYQAFVVEKRPPAYDTAATMCRYLTEDGRKCAVGLVLPEGHPVQKQEASLALIISRYPELFDPKLRSLSSYHLIRVQQLLHDNLIDFDTGEWAVQDLHEHYVRVAEKYELTIPPMPDPQQ